MSEYSLMDFSEVPDLVSQVTRLNTAAFAEYEGALLMGDEFTRWYLQRPGSSSQLCVGALAGEQLVSMVLVTVQPVQVGGRLLSCGIVDSVGTDPAHRRQGLARKLMEMAHERMQAAGADAALLYTNPEGLAYHFYNRMDYQTRAQCVLFEGKRPAKRGSLAVRLARTDDHDAIIRMLDSFYADYEGYAPLRGELWDWHKVNRPAEMPLQLLVAEAGDRLVATCSLGTVRLLLDSDTVAVTAMSDFAWLVDACDGQEALSALLAEAAQENLVCLLDETDQIAGLCEAVGLEKAIGEVSMLLPFTPQAHDAMLDKSGPWYVMAESVIGV
ncbi:MAG: GNAT family N-acetyltransferase [candidate division WS1 bacterium]|nr:GNAT family N-acetyltransferase [candidate division WS1 bacterium]